MFHCKIRPGSDLIFLNVQLPDVWLPEYFFNNLIQQVILKSNTIFQHVNMHSYNICTGAYHLTKFLVFDYTAYSALYLQTLTFWLCFRFETVTDLDQYNDQWSFALCACIMLVCVHSFEIACCSALISAYLSGLYTLYICFSHLNTVNIFSTFCFGII